MGKNDDTPTTEKISRNFHPKRSRLSTLLLAPLLALAITPGCSSLSPGGTQLAQGFVTGVASSGINSYAAQRGQNAAGGIRINGGNQRQAQIPENVILGNNNTYTPAPGFVWANLGVTGDFRVRRVEELRREVGARIDAAIQAGIRAQARTQLPENVIRNNDDTYTPAAGYEWENPGVAGDFKVRRGVADPEETQVGLHTYVNIKDINGDGVINKSEIFGLDEQEFKSGGEIGIFFTSHSNIPINVTYALWTFEGELVGGMVGSTKRGKMYRRFGNSNSPTEGGDFMDRLYHSGPGDYVVTASTPDGKIYRRDISIK